MPADAINFTAIGLDWNQLPTITLVGLAETGIGAKGDCWSSERLVTDSLPWLFSLIRSGPNRHYHRTMVGIFRNTATLAAFAAVGFLGTSCAEAPAPTPAQGTTGEFVDEFQADLNSEVVLDINGQTFDLAQLSSSGSSTLEVFEPFDKVDTEFEVVNFGDLLLQSGFNPSDEVVTIALNDYRYTDTVENFIEKEALIAYLENGKEIPISEGGPIRIVFAEDSDYYEFLDAWNWSLALVEKTAR